MGQEARCVVRRGRRVSEGRALLESAEILFRGGIRLAIPFSKIESVTASDGVLRVRTAEGATAFEIGPAAAKWAEKIRNPRPLIDKLGVKPGMTVSVIGLRGAGILEDVRARTAVVATGRARKDSDLILLGVDSVAALDRLPALCDSIRRNGGLWVVWPKGRTHIKEDHVRRGPAGRVDRREGRGIFGDPQRAQAGDPAREALRSVVVGCACSALLFAALVHSAF